LATVGNVFDSFSKTDVMKNFVLILGLALGLAACGNNSAEGEKDPSTVHPPSEAIPDSMKLVNDSLIVPDTVPGNGSQVGKSDSIQKNKH
jgi:hypothetical protein